MLLQTLILFSVHPFIVNVAQAKEQDDDNNNDNGDDQDFEEEDSIIICCSWGISLLMAN